VNKKVSVVGLGYVGLPLALLAKRRGYDVLGIDTDTHKVELINQQESPFFDNDISVNIKKYPILATDCYDNLSTTDIIIVCVPTPVDDEHMPDLTIVISTCLAIASKIKKGQLLIIESTINPGVCDDIIIPLIEAKSGLKCNTDFYVAHCPERINPGDTKWGVFNIPRVLGASGKKGLKLAYDFYTTILDAQVKKMDSIKEAEAVKVVENSFRDVNIAFVNELAMSFDKLGIDVVNVIDGAATKPFSFMAHYPGVGVGGHCIPVDPYYLIEYARTNGFTHKFLTVAREINNGMPEYVVNILLDTLSTAKKPIQNIKIVVLGLSYKPNVGDLRESPSLVLLSLLQKNGVKVIATDPYITDANGYVTKQANTKKQILDILKDADVAIIATSHNEYTGLTPSDFKKSGVNIVIDGRNCLDKSAFSRSGINYKGVGR